jgi:hypothetical protein
MVDSAFMSKKCTFTKDTDPEMVQGLELCSRNSAV